MYTHQKPHNNQPRTLLYATIIQKRKIHKVKKSSFGHSRKGKSIKYEKKIHLVIVKVLRFENCRTKKEIFS